MPTAHALLLLLAAQADVTCDSPRQCNELGTAAYKAGRLAEATRLFDRQIDYADTALEQAEIETPALQQARDVALNNAVLAHLRAGHCLKALDVALNNAVLAHLRAGHCLKARAYLDLADAGSRATQANRRQLETRCAAAQPNGPLAGTFWQYAGHGAWNQVTLQPLDSGKTRLDAFWMRIARGPLDEWGPAAFGALDDIALQPNDAGLRGRFEGNDGALSCEVAIADAGQAIEVTITAGDNCATGGAGAYFGGTYRRVEHVTE